MTPPSEPSEATKPTTPPRTRRWFRRRIVWLLMTPLLLVISAITVHWFLSLGSKSTLELCLKISNKADTDFADRVWLERIGWAIEKIGFIPGAEDWAAHMATQILVPAMSLSVEFHPGSQPLTEEEFADLAKIKNVVVINFANQPLNETRLKHLSRMTWLKELSVDFSSLEEEDESGVEVTNATSPSSEAHPPATETLFKDLHQIRQLKKLKLNVGEMSPSLRDWIALQSDLTELDLTCHHATLEFLQTLTKLKKLTSFKLHAALTRDPSNDLPSPKQSPGQVVQTSRTTSIKATASNAGLTFPALHHLWLCTGRNPGVEDIVHQFFAQNKQLTSLELGTLGLTSQLIDDISALQNLTRLNLFSQKPLTVEQLRVATSLPKLTSLGLNGCRLEGDAINVINACQALETLEIQDTNLTNDDFQRLKTNPPMRWSNKSNQFNGTIHLKSKDASSDKPGKS